jgi:tetratricopeptide (TPR) repeat protein
MTWFCYGAAVLTALLLASAPQRRPSAWDEAVSLYLAGEFERALEVVNRIDAADYEENVLGKKAVVLGALKPPFRRARVKAVLAIDTELTISRGAIVICAGEREPHPRHLADLTRVGKPLALSALEDSTAGPVDYAFLTRWYRLATAYDQGRGDLASTRLCIDTALPQVRSDPEILLASGAILETAATHQIEEGESESAWQLEMRRAELAYRGARAGAPDLLEAQVRLGRVVALQGRHKDALEVLQPLREAGDAPIAYLARMFAGLAYQRLGSPAEARREFTAAEALIPGLPSPPVASALTAFLQDDRDAARRMVLDMAKRPATETVDPWAWYTKGTASRTAGYLNAMRLAAIR